MKFPVRGLFIGLMLFMLAGCVSGPPNLPAQHGGHGVLQGAYTIDVGDQVSISVWKNPELSITEPVRPDGKIAVHLVGDIMAAGKSPEELARRYRDEAVELYQGSQCHRHTYRACRTGLSVEDPCDRCC